MCPLAYTGDRAPPRRRTQQRCCCAAEGFIAGALRDRIERSRDHDGIVVIDAGGSRCRSNQTGFLAFQRWDGQLVDAGTHPVKYLQMACFLTAVGAPAAGSPHPCRPGKS